MRYFAITLIVGSGTLCLAGQSPSAVGSICGTVLRADSPRPIAGVNVVAVNEARRSPFLSQTSASDGGFCFRILSPGQYSILVFKTGFALAPSRPRTDIEYAEITLAHPNPVLQIHMTPTLLVTSADYAFSGLVTREQRRDLGFEDAKFSPDGRFIAVQVSVTGKDSTFGQQIWRYEFAARRWIPITPAPAYQAPGGGDIAWSGAVLYTSSTGPYGKELYFVTEGGNTTAIASIPPQLKKPRNQDPLQRKVGPYVIKGQFLDHSMIQLTVGDPPFVIANGGSDSDNWVTLDNPPAFFYGGDDLHVFYLQTHRRQIARVPNGRSLDVLAAEKASSGFRVAYSSHGQCDVDPATLTADFSYSNNLPAYLCFVDIPDESRPRDSALVSTTR